ncbi:MAG: alpha/beta hydrolase [Candidatus Binatia bacterium]
MREERISFSNSRGDVLSGVLHHPEDKGLGAVILCHGMESNKESDKLVSLSRQLASRDIMTLRFDFAYAGESSGKFEDITYSGEVEDLAAAYSLVQTRHSGKTAILGSSMGGTVALLFAAQEPGVAGLVTVAAPIHPENFPKRILTPPQTQQWRERGFTFYNGQRINLSLLRDLERINVPESVKKISCPVLILHGDADMVVPVEEAYEIHACLTNSKRISILRGADHRLSDPATMERAMAEAVDWLTENIA